MDTSRASCQSPLPSCHHIAYRVVICGPAGECVLPDGHRTIDGARTRRLQLMAVYTNTPVMRRYGCREIAALELKFMQMFPALHIAIYVEV
jgi:hypothetical protein